MIDTTVIDNQFAVLLAADTTTLANATAMHVHLIVGPFTPGPALDFTTLTEASFPGYAAAVCGSGAQGVYTDPLTGLRVVSIIPPTGGFKWVSSGVVSPTQTVYGYVLTDHTDLITYGSELLPTAVVIAGTGDGYDAGNVSFNLQRNISS